MARARSRRSRAALAGIVVAAIAAVLMPLPGPTPMRCVYGSDYGGCEELFSRNAFTIVLARSIWGAEVVHVNEDGTPR